MFSEHLLIAAEQASNSNVSLSRFILGIEEQAGNPTTGIAPWMRDNLGNMLHTIQITNPSGDRPITWIPGPRLLSEFKGQKATLGGSIADLAGAKVLVKDRWMLGVQSLDGFRTTAVYWAA